MTRRSCICCLVNFCYVPIGLAWFSVTFRFGRALRSVVVWCCLHDGLCSCACCPVVGAACAMRSDAVSFAMCA